jgi:hypothetical protein
MAAMRSKRKTGEADKRGHVLTFDKNTCIEPMKSRLNNSNGLQKGRRDAAGAPVARLLRSAAK